MEVWQLITELSKLPPHTKVVAKNNSSYEDGEYVVTNVDYWGKNKKAIIGTDHKKRLKKDGE